MRGIPNFLKPGAPYFVFGASILAFQVMMSILPIPDFPTILLYLRGMLQSTGLWAVGAAYFIEGLFLISFYWPGSFVLFVAVAAASGSIPLLIKIWVIINLAGFAALVTNAVIGRYGIHHILMRIFGSDLYRKATAVAERRGIGALIVLGFHINWLAMAVVYFASLRKPRITHVLGFAGASHLCGSALLITICSLVDLTAEGTNANIVVFLISGSIAIGIWKCIRQTFRHSVT